jgi:Protein of unknown function (DUF3106)
MRRLSLTVLLLGALAAQAQVPGLAGKPWDSLSAAQREVLAPLSSQWTQMDASSRDTWALLAQRYPKLDAAEQARLRERMRDWAALSPQERQRVHQGFLAAQRVGAAERQARWEQYQALSPEQRQAFQERAARRQALSASAPASAARRGQRDNVDPQTLLPQRKAP